MEVKRKPWIKILSCFLSALMVLQILPLTVFANDFQNSEQLKSTPAAEINFDDLQIVDEVTENRSEYSKTYLLENGMYCEISSASPIHYDNNGTFEDITAADSSCSSIGEAAAYIADLSDSKAADSKYDINLNDGLVTQSNNNLNLYGAELTEDDNGNLSWNITNLYGIINEFSSVLVKPLTVTNPQPSYSKTEVTVDAQIKLTCNSEASDLSYNTYIQTFKDKWSGDSFSPDELLELDDDFNFVNVSEQIYDYNTIDEAGNYVWDITSVYCKWENGTKENNGLIIRTAGTENIYITGGTLVRYYRVIDENDSGFAYHTENMGRAGTLFVNNYTNVPMLQRNELSIEGNKMPVSLSRYITNGLESDSFGAGGRWNYSSELKYSNDTFIWNMPDGSSKRFQKSSDNEYDNAGREKWVEYLYNGGECTLWVDPVSRSTLPYDFSNNILIDEDENTYRFNSVNKLISISSRDNISINIDYKNDKISSITDGEGRKYIFDNSGFTAPYNNVKSVSLVNSNNNPITYDGSTALDIEYSYAINNGKVCLTSAQYADGKTVAYEYDSYGRLTVIKNIDNSKLELEYYNSDASENLNPVYFSRLKSYTKSVYDTENQKYAVNYTVEFDADDTYRHTVKTTSNGKTTTEISQYNTNLDTLYITNTDGSEFYADYDNSHKLQSFTVKEDNLNNLVANGNMREKKLGGGPKYWNMINLNKTTCLISERGNDYCVEFANSIDQTRGLYQDISIEGKKNDKYVISAWGKASATIPKNARFWGVRILALNENGQTETIHEMAFDTSLWNVEQIRKTAFSLPFDTTKLTVQLLSCDQLYTVQFDDVELYKTDNSYVSAVDDNSSENSTCICSNCSEANCPCKCDSESSCTCITCKRGITVSYDENGNEITTITDGEKSIITKNSFSPSGNYLASSTDEFGATTYYIYNEDNATLTSMASGYKTDSIDYSYNAIGLLKTVSQTVTNILTGENVNMLSTYTYDGDTLTQINHNGSVYSFDYDMYGNIINVKIGIQSLAEYSYNSDQLNYLLYGNGDKINYTFDANGNITSISTQRHDEETDELIEYTYTYKSDGTLLSYTDNVNGTVTQYSDNGYTITIPASDENADDITVYSTATADDDTDITLFGYSFNTKKYADNYDPQTGLTTASAVYTLPVKVVDITGTGELLTVTDYFGRNISSSFKLNTDDLAPEFAENINQYDYSVNNSYTYVTDENNVTGNLVESCTSSIQLHYNLSEEEKKMLEEEIEKEKPTQEEIDEFFASLTQTLQSATTSYEYDNAGRITKIYLNGELLQSYKYDEAGQLTEDVSYKNYSKTQYIYDEGGNITYKIYYEDAVYNNNEVVYDENNEIVFDSPTEVISYSYDNSQWGDLLTNYNGMDIEYDEIGNPLNYQNHNYAGIDFNATLEWNGRLLTALSNYNDSGDPGERYEYSYNADGLRTRKDRYVWKNDGTGYELCQYNEYIWEDNQLKGYRINYPGINDNPNKNPQIIVLPIYDDYNEVLGMAVRISNIILNDSQNEEEEIVSEDVFYLTKDAQGNILSMYDPLDNSEMVYEYDAYGQILSISIPKREAEIDQMPSGTFLEALAKALAAAGLMVTYSMYKEINPFIYRGYMYDGETGLYYNQSRYYAPNWGRFLNADETLDTGSCTSLATNVFSYCENDPINYTDSDGLASKTKSFSKSKKILKGSDLYVSFSASISWSTKGAGITLKGLVNLYLSKADSNTFTSCASMAGSAVAGVVSAALIGSTSGTAAAVVPIVASAVGGIVTNLFYEYYKKDSNGRIRIKRSITIRRGVGRY